MLTRIVAKQAKTARVKNKFVNGKKVQGTLSCLFGGRGKVQFRRKKLGDKVQAKSSNLQLFAAVSTPNIAELALFVFFLSTTMVFRAFRTHFAGKTPAFSH